MLFDTWFGITSSRRRLKLVELFGVFSLRLERGRQRKKETLDEKLSFLKVMPTAALNSIRGVYPYRV